MKQLGYSVALMPKMQKLRGGGRQALSSTNLQPFRKLCTAVYTEEMDFGK